LSKFGASFLSKCNAATCPSPLLKHVNFIDTPGILSGEKQRVTRGYNFEQVVSFLAEKVDRILLLFDAHKLDISDELKRTILATTGNEEKIRIVLNKVDSLEPAALQRVNGALMWSLGKVLKCPEVPKVYVGSFWDQPLKYPQYRELFQNDTTALFEDIRSLPRTVNVRRINDVVKRAKQVKLK
uniref:Dynamin-type G domain-containing protein n=1 Tax=Romanomermis culicivorax TaxID=13658 RepID=A0A915JHH4_ROMCU